MDDPEVIDDDALWCPRLDPGRWGRRGEWSASYVHRHRGASRGAPMCRHRFAEMTVVVAGSCRIDLGTRAVEMAPGGAILIPAGVAHREIRAASCDTVWVGLAQGPAGADPVASGSDPALGELATRLWRLAQYAATGGAELDALCAALGEALLRQGAIGHGGLIDAAIDALAADLHRPLAVPELAARLRCSASWLHRRFRAETGETPTGYRTRLRIERMLDLVCRSGLSVAAAAAEVGFEDPLYASRVCRRVTGHPPSWWRGGIPKRS